MVTANYHIRFDFLMEVARLNLILEADVQEHHSDKYYLVFNICIAGRAGDAILPPISIRQHKGQWVHTDSGKTTDLSAAVGNAIDAVIGRRFST